MPYRHVDGITRAVLSTRDAPSETLRRARFVERRRAGVAMKSLIRIAALLLVLVIPLRALPSWAQSDTTVTVLYAGSLVTPMEGPIKDALRAQGIDMQSEGGGSKKLANLISSGLRNPDVFISVDPKLVTALGKSVASAVTFAGTSLGLAWSDHSKYAALFADVASGKHPLLDALATPGLRIGRTDPKLDPKGGYTIRGLTVL